MDLVSRLLYRDASVLVIDKPFGLSVHAAGRHDHLGLFLDQLTFGLPRPPELAHRLDRETSGCLVLGRHRQALRRLGQLFASGSVGKVYWALTIGAPPAETGLIDKKLMKINPARGRMKIDPAGQASQTEWRILGRAGRLTWVECRPLTGRTHQIRIHLASIGCPIVGDSLYGRGTADLESPELHLLAQSVSVPYDFKKKPIAVTAPVPTHMAERLTRCGWSAP